MHRENIANHTSLRKAGGGAWKLVNAHHYHSSAGGTLVSLLKVACANAILECEGITRGFGILFQSDFPASRKPIGRFFQGRPLFGAVAIDHGRVARRRHGHQSVAVKNRLFHIP